MDPKVTIIIPTYNRADLLPLAIEGALSQTCDNFELLVLDDASTDNTHDVVLPYLKDERVRYLKHSRNISIAANRNYGLSIAKGEYIAMLDSDDIWLDINKLQRQVAILDTQSEYGLVGTNAEVIDKIGQRVGRIRSCTSDSAIKRTFFLKNHFVQSSVLIRKKALDDVGGYNEIIPIWEDYELWLRIGERYKLMNIPEFLTGYRNHDANISKTSEKKNLEAYRLIYRLHGKKYPMKLLLLLKIWMKTISFRLGIRP